ncbi:uncharacterized protein METZ01_LOCUS388012 [marine metagenome]|uniref:Uncharacterized protein n=1 Tax=marine metagenome TaxID=408172 RepID=A0A382UN76_9ZZZZ
MQIYCMVLKDEHSSNSFFFSSLPESIVYSHADQRKQWSYPLVSKPEN